MQCESCIKFDKVTLYYNSKYKDCWLKRGNLEGAPASFGKYDPVLEQAAFQWQINDFERLRKLDCKCKKKSHKGNGTYSGPFAFTLTKSPHDPQTVDDMIAAVKKVMSQRSCPVARYAWYLEYKENNTHPHIHGMYETITKGRIEKKHWERAWTLWDEKDKKGLGFRGGYHRPVRHEECYDDYIKKDGGIGDSFVPQII